MTTHEPVTVDVAVLGGGSAAEMLAQQLAKEGTDVAIVERHLVGGECPYYACIPSKVMLRTAELRHLLADAEELGAAGGPVERGPGPAAFRRAAQRRDEKAEHHDDRAHVASLEEQGVTVVRGDGRFDGPGRVVVETGDGGQRVVTAEELVLATGSTPVVPDVPGLAAADPWTFVEAWTASELPESLLVIGAGAVGVEIAQTYARYGCQVVLVQRSRLLGTSVEPETAQDLAEVLRGDGVVVHTGAEATAVMAADGGWRVAIDDDEEEVTVERICVAAGMTPATAGVGLESFGLDPDDLRIDERCRVEGAEHLWAIGDVTDISPFTHTANYHGRVVARNLLGRDAAVDHRSIPRTTYTSPEVAAVGLTTAQAEEAGLDAARHVFDLANTSRGFVDHATAGRLVLVADRSRGVLVGASLIGPAAGESIAELALAVRAEVPLGVLGDVVHAFPTWSEGIGYAVRELLEEGFSDGGGEVKEG